MTQLASVEVEQREATCLVRASGEIDISNAQEVLAAIVAAVPNGAHHVVLDITELSYLDSAGVALVLRLSGRLQGRRLAMSLVVPPASPVRAVLEVAGVPKIVPLLDALDDSLPGVGSDG
jgi:anti-anti-sigma factor